MQVIRQDHDGLDREWTLLPRDPERHPQGVHVLHQRRGYAVSKRDREEIGAARDEVASVSDHRRTLSRISLHLGYKLFVAARMERSEIRGGASSKSCRCTLWDG